MHRLPNLNMINAGRLCELHLRFQSNSNVIKIIVNTSFVNDEATKIILDDVNRQISLCPII